MSKIKAFKNDRWSLLTLALGYLWLVKRVCPVAWPSTFMSLSEESILASLGRWFCCCCLAWSLLLSTRQSGPRNATDEKRSSETLQRDQQNDCVSVKHLTCRFNTKCFPFQYLSICRDCRVLTMSTGLTAVSWLISANYTNHMCFENSGALWFWGGGDGIVCHCVFCLTFDGDLLALEIVHVSQ